MNILIFGGNWYNRGDESAIRAMLDELRVLYPDCNLKIQFNQSVQSVPIDNVEVIQPFIRLAGRNKLKKVLYELAIRTNGKVPYIGTDAPHFYKFVEAVKWADYAIYAPGGPSIGDYYGVRKLLLDMIDIIRRNSVPYSFFAPSVGPFSVDQNRVKEMLDGAEVLCFRESISQGYYASISPNKKTTVTLDAAFQHPIDEECNMNILLEDKELNAFLEKYEKVVGVTITDLLWHRIYKLTDRPATISKAFSEFIPWLEDQGYGIIFIPQLFGNDNDKDYMSSFVGDACFVVSDKYDCYFQQYLISRLYAVVGMRYHSNIFSAKMGTPFVSVAYEQKMEGFMKKAGLSQYCVDINQLSGLKLEGVFSMLVNNYDEYKKYIMNKRSAFRDESYKTMEMISIKINEHCLPQGQ